MSNAPQMLNNPATHDRPTLGMWELLFFVGVISAGFFVVDHSVRASSYYESVYEYSDAVNRTADRVERVNLITAPVRIVLGMLGAACLLMAPRTNIKWGGAISFAFLLYLTYLGASVAWSVSPRVTIQKFAVFCMMSVAAYGISRRLSLQDQAIVFSLVCVTYIVVGLAVEIALGNFAPHRSEYRFVGTCHPNSLAAYGTVCCLASPVFTKHGRSLSAMSWAMIAIGIIVLLATRSRTTLAGMAFAVLATRMVTFKPNQRALGISLVLLAFVVVGMSLALSRTSTLAAAGDTMAMGRTEDVTSLTGRLPLWEEMGRSIKERPWMGHGYLAYWEKEQIEYLADILHWEVPHGHNMYLDVMLDGGIFGLLLFLAFFLITLAVAFGRYLRTRDIGVAFVFGMVTFALVHGFAESLFKLPTYLLFIIVTSAMRLSSLPDNLDRDDKVISTPLPESEGMTSP